MNDDTTDKAANKAANKTANKTGNLDKLDIVALNVADLKRSITWYQTSFECEVIFEDKVSAILQFGNIKLKLILPSAQPPHIGFTRADAGAFGELRKQRDGSEATMLSDPTGNLVAIIAR